MEILVERFQKTKISTISKLSVDGVHECFTLEDTDRGLNSNMTLLEIKARKIFGKTAIPSGRYRIVINFSEKFKKYLPEILNVKGFQGIRIHPGNIAEDTEGCLLAGFQYTSDKVLNSTYAFNQLLIRLKLIEKKEEIWITIK